MGSDFLVTKFRVGRQIITDSPLPETSAVQARRVPLRTLIIADPTENLPEARKEGEQLCTLLDEIPGIEVKLWCGRMVRKVALLTELQAHDVVHFAGHSYYNPSNPGESGWRLHEGMLAADELSRLTSPPLLVFSNSCQAGAAADRKGSFRYEGQAFGIGSAFLLAGVKNYIGTFWVVHDEESVLFATAF
jgi:CHAT domain-containing protein